MTMKLLMSAPSPFARKVRVMISELKIDIEELQVQASPLGGEDALNAANPLGKIPALVRDSGPTIYDSRVISTYLNDSAQGDLYPNARRTETMILEATADGICDAAVAMVYEARVRDTAQISHDYIEAQWTKVARALQAIETRWMSHLHGPLDMAHIAMGASLGYLDLRHEDRNWRANAPELAKWFATFETRPAMMETDPR